MSEENVELVRTGYEAWNRSDLDGVLAVFAPDVELVTTRLFVGLDPVYRGHDGFKKFWRDFRGMAVAPPHHQRTARLRRPRHRSRYV
jgi:ketosteroid isomerase-like protein